MTRKSVGDRFADVVCDRCGETYLPHEPGEAHFDCEDWHDPHFDGHRAECTDCGRVATNTNPQTLVTWNEYGVCPSCGGGGLKWTAPDGTVTYHETETARTPSRYAKFADY